MPVKVKKRTLVRRRVPVRRIDSTNASRKCASVCQSKMRQIQDLNDELTQEVAALRKFQRDCNDYATMFDRYILKFAQCVPRVVSLKKRLEESYDILLDVENLVAHFADSEKLTRYLLGDDTFRFESHPEDARRPSSTRNTESPLVKERPPREHQRFDQDMETINETREESAIPINLQQTFDKPMEQATPPDFETLRRVSNEGYICLERRSSKRMSLKSKRNSRVPSLECAVTLQPYEDTQAQRCESQQNSQELEQVPEPMIIDTINIPQKEAVGGNHNASPMNSSSISLTPHHTKETSFKTPCSKESAVPLEVTPTNQTIVNVCTSTPASEATGVPSPPRVSMIPKESMAKDYVNENGRKRRKAILVEPSHPSGTWLPPKRRSIAKRNTLVNENLNPELRPMRKTVVFEEPPMSGRTFVKPAKSPANRRSIQRRTVVKSSPAKGIVLNEIPTNRETSKTSPKSNRSKSDQAIAQSPDNSGRRSGRRTTKVSYVERPLNCKLRRQ